MKFENKVLPNEEQLKGFTDEPEKGPIKMLNLVKLKIKLNIRWKRNKTYRS